MEGEVVDSYHSYYKVAVVGSLGHTCIRGNVQQYILKMVHTVIALSDRIAEHCNFNSWGGGGGGGITGHPYMKHCLTNYNLVRSAPEWI